MFDADPVFIMTAFLLATGLNLAGSFPDYPVVVHEA
jgi:hypothetical protein